MATTSTPNRLQNVLARIKPFNELDKTHQMYILAWKSEYQNHDRELRAYLDTFALQQLEPYLTWIPHSALVNFTQLAEGGFAKVYKAYVLVNQEFRPMAAKELKRSMIAEVRRISLMVSTNRNLLVIFSIYLFL